MNTAVIHANKRSVKSTLKILLIALPTLGLLTGIGIGLILGASESATTPDLYIKIGAVILPPVSLLTIAFVRYFKQIDNL